MTVDMPEGTLTFEMMLCLPKYTEESRESILESFEKVKRFYDKNKGKLLHEIEWSPDEILIHLSSLYSGSIGFESRLKLLDKTELTPVQILEDFLDSYLESTDFEYNQGLLDKLEKDSPKEILEDFLKPYLEGTVFEGHQEYYRVILFRFNRYFKKLQRGTLYHMGDTEEDRAHNRLFDQFRSNTVGIVSLLCESIDIWYRRTQSWNEKHSQNIN